MRARAAGVVLALAILMGSCSNGGGGVGVDDTTTSTGPPRPLVWAAMGDSYSAGIGGPGATVSVAGCQQDQPDAFATVALADLAQSLPRQTFEQRFVACGGATTADVLSTQLPAARDADIASLTIGGNDLGFTQVVGACIQSGCASYDRPTDDLPGITPEPGRTDWDTLTDRLTATFVAIRQAMAADGWLFVLSYPIPAPERLGATCPSGSAPLQPRDIVLADAMALRLGDAIADAADRANSALTATRPGHVVFVDWRVATGSPSRTTRTVDGVEHDVAFNPDGLCTADPMINGITLADLGDSFHPTARGVSVAARDLAGAIAPRVG
jgi:lysophospholipase L1-like esterase